MPIFKFTRDTLLAREGGDFRVGDEVEMTQASIDRWLRRNAGAQIDAMSTARALKKAAEQGAVEREAAERVAQEKAAADQRAAEELERRRQEHANQVSVDERAAAEKADAEVDQKGGTKPDDEAKPKVGSKKA